MTSIMNISTISTISTGAAIACFLFACRVPDDGPPPGGAPPPPTVKAAPAPSPLSGASGPSLEIAELSAVGLNPASARARLAPGLEKARRCAGAVRARGDARVRMEIAPTGAVTRLVLSPDVPGPPELRDCLHDALQRIHFAPVSGATAPSLTVRLRIGG